MRLRLVVPGDIELVLGLDTYTQTVVCTANTEVFILDHRNIERLIYRKNPGSMSLIREKVEGKLRARLQMRAGSRLDLYRPLLDKVECRRIVQDSNTVVPQISSYYSSRIDINF